MKTFESSKREKHKHKHTFECKRFFADTVVFKYSAVISNYNRDSFFFILLLFSFYFSFRSFVLAEELLAKTTEINTLNENLTAAKRSLHR